MIYECSCTCSSTDLSLSLLQKWHLDFFFWRLNFSSCPLLLFCRIVTRLVDIKSEVVLQKMLKRIFKNLELNCCFYVKGIIMSELYEAFVKISQRKNTVVCYYVRTSGSNETLPKPLDTAAYEKEGLLK